MSSRFDTIAGAISFDKPVNTRAGFVLTLRDVCLLRDAVDVLAVQTTAEQKAIDRLRRILHEAVDASA